MRKPTSAEMRGLLLGAIGLEAIEQQVDDEFKVELLDGPNSLTIVLIPLEGGDRIKYAVTVAMEA